MPATTISDLRVIIGEDEQMLAIDLTQQLEDLGARVVRSLSNVAELDQLLASGLDGANAAILDVDLLDGSVLPLVPRLEQAGVAVAICSGYTPEERPADLAHVPWIGKPARAADIASTLCLAVDTRKALEID